jgi:hypothetical protein
MLLRTVLRLKGCTQRVRLGVHHVEDWESRKGVHPVMSTDHLRDYLGRRLTQLLSARGLDGGRPLGTLTEGLTGNQMGWADYKRKVYSA